MIVIGIGFGVPFNNGLGFGSSVGGNFLLLENATPLLLENGSNLLLE